MINHPYKTAKGLKRYVRDILQQVQQEETLKKIIDISSKIDYPVMMIKNLKNLQNYVGKKTTGDCQKMKQEN